MKSLFTWSVPARAALNRLDRDTAMRILLALTRLAQSGQGDVKALQPPFVGQHRLRVGDWRIRFEVVANNPDRQTYNVLALENRGQAYR